MNIISYSIGIVPPPNDFDKEKYDNYLSKIINRIDRSDINSVLIYDIQENDWHKDMSRPFKYQKTCDPRVLTSDLKKRYSRDIKYFTYVALNQDNSSTCEVFENFIKDAVNIYSVENIVLVNTTNGNHILLEDACRILKNFRINFGGVVIPERHRNKKDEHKRIYERSKMGMSFFTSQIIYNADNIITFLKDYNELLKQNNDTPCKIILSFAPFGRAETCKFLEWLGVEISLGTSNRILSRKSTDECIDESIEICTGLLSLIKFTYQKNQLTIPIGINIESVSKFNNEQDAVDKLLLMLKEN